jgi:hypothetical protein
MYNSTVCVACHGQYEIHANDTQMGNNTVECATCHANTSLWTSAYGEKQVHGIRYLNDSGVYDSAFTRTTAANCTTCHQGSIIDLINTSPFAPTLSSLPKIPAAFNHSDNSSAGSLWNKTDPGFFGPWNTNNQGNSLRACLYCHGNVNSTFTSVDDIANIVHNETALGRSNAMVR